MRMGKLYTKHFGKLRIPKVRIPRGLYALVDEESLKAVEKIEKENEKLKKEIEEMEKKKKLK